MEILTEIAIFIITVFASILGSIVGVGGGLIIVPSLLYLEIRINQAIPLSILSIVVNSFISSLINTKNRLIDFKIATKSIALVLLGAYIGSLLFININKLLLYFLFPILVISLMALNIKGIKIRSRIAYLLFFIAGVISNLLGIGGGIIFVPVFATFLGLDYKRAAATSLFLILISTLLGSIVYLISNYYELTFALSTLLGSAIGSVIGSLRGRRIDDRTRRKIFIAIASFASIYTFYKGLLLII